MKTVCPRCRAEYAINQEYVGTPMTCVKCNTSFTIAAAPETPPPGPAGAASGWNQPAGAYPGWGPTAGPGKISMLLSLVRSARLTWLLVFMGALGFLFVLGGLLVGIDILSVEVPGVGGYKKFEMLLLSLGFVGTVVFFILSSFHMNVCLSRIADSEERRKQ
ncbi:MAG: hypothetical protein LBQ79_02770 [Deltaproteobacteria bacterium]|jgi:predicted Zn finger-like uncharacterized protein|nr:hypothetical protein [Deltaproteobacteria bacterium]